ncbi:MAG TPA: molybdopterin-dependent oxidoreductase [Lapillicoccus sp.]|uniref:molybdopterin-dependent oxidoreductase n=1 Tax=Lapillicoccus sp. TaxID=1909287 RepID=UPI002F93E5C1
MTDLRTRPADTSAEAPTAPRILYALSGVLAALAGIAVGHLVAAVTNAAASPVLSVGSVVIDLTPTPVKELVIARVGTADKPILLATVSLATLALAALAGLLSRRRPAVGAGVLLLLVVAAGGAAMTRPTARLLDLLPALATAIVGVSVLLGLHRLLEPATAGLRGSGASRRTFLVGAAGITAGAAVAGALGQRLAERATDTSGLTLPAPANPTPPLPVGVESTVQGVSPFRTPTASFYRVDTNLTVPRVSVGSWSLEIDGDVRSPFTLTYDELLALPMIERDITLTCVSNEVGGGYVGAARWLGVRLTDVLDRAGVGTQSDQLLSTAVDGFTISTPLAVVRDGRDAMIAVGMNGEPLTDTHGFPARLVTPGLYGFVGATKWLTKLTLTTYAAQQSYWTQRQWATNAPIKTSARIDTPAPLSTVAPGRTVIGGVAWAQHRGVGKVEVQIDGGAWQPAQLGPDAGIDYWRQWFVPWDATSGQHTLAVRATDLTGALQTDQRTTPFPEGSSGIQQVVVIVS